MRRLLLTTATLIVTAVPALAGNWYIVAGASGHCKISQFTPEAFKAGISQEGATVVDRSDPSNGGLIEYAVTGNGRTTGMVFVNDAARCESTAQLMVAMHMMPSEMRQAIKNAPR